MVREEAIRDDGEVVDAARAVGSTDEEARENQIVALHHCLQALEDFRPSSPVNRLFQNLVSLSTEALNDLECRRILKSRTVRPILPGLRALCAKGETELERHWALRLLAAEDPGLELMRFPYFRNYQDLTRLEVQALDLCRGRRCRRAVFVGGGPLPLSALLMARDHGFSVVVLDRDPEAVELSRRVTERLDVQDIDFASEDALQHTGYGEHDVAVLASLVGASAAQKRRIVETMAERMSAGAYLLVRSAHKLRSLLYPTIDETELPGFEPEVTVHPHNHIINSVIVARRQAKARSW